MSESSSTLHPVTQAAGDGDEFDLVDYCARPLCRKEFHQSAGRGRRRDFCSETCRRLADRDYKRARAMVDQFERLAQRSRHDVLAFGRTADENGADPVETDVLLERARGAVSRAKAVLRFAGDGESRWALELQALCDGVEGLTTGA